MKTIDSDWQTAVSSQ